MIKEFNEESLLNFVNWAKDKNQNDVFYNEPIEDGSCNFTLKNGDIMPDSVSVTVYRTDEESCLGLWEKEYCEKTAEGDKPYLSMDINYETGDVKMQCDDNFWTNRRIQIAYQSNDSEVKRLKKELAKANEYIASMTDHYDNAIENQKKHMVQMIDRYLKSLQRIPTMPAIEIFEEAMSFKE